MYDGTVKPVAAPPECRRVIGRHRGERDGPTMVVLGGIHGNEPSGVRAARRVLDALGTERPGFRGELVALIGNLAALERRTRYVGDDLNRRWTDERLQAVLRDGDDRSPEDEEQRELHAALLEATLRARGPVVFIDLHTSSAEGPPFLTIGDTLRNREFAFRFPLPVILGLEEQVDGALLEYMNNQGHVTLGVEGGHHESESSVDHHEGAVWLALAAARMIDPREIPARAGGKARNALRRAARGIPRVIEVRHRHAIHSGDGFRMEPGFRNFQRVSRGQRLARDRNGEIQATEKGLILLPLYQGLGNDGFFLAREILPFWLRVSSVLRRLRLDRLIHRLPGVRRHSSQPGSLLVHTRIARFYPLEVFHLLGYRKRRRRGSILVVSRRRFDVGTR